MTDVKRLLRFSDQLNDAKYGIVLARMASNSETIEDEERSALGLLFNRLEAQMGELEKEFTAMFEEAKA
jgi:hypothetical protein